MEEQDIVDETVSVDESIIVEEATVSHREEEPESRRELEEGELSESDDENVDYSMVSDTYDEVLDVGHNVSRNVGRFLSSVRQEQQQQSRALQREQPATQMHRVENERQGRYQPGRTNHGRGIERTNVPFLTKKTKKKCNLR